MKYRGLLITFWLPPLNSAASHRTGAFIEAFNKSDEFSLDVMCPEREGDTIEKVNYLYTHKESSEVRYSHYRQTNSLLQKIKTWLIYDFLKLQFLFELKGGRFYTEGKKVLENVEENKYDFVLCSYGPLDVFLLAEQIKINWPNTPIILDYRDHMTFNPMRNLGIWTALFYRKEKRILKSATFIIGVSQKLVYKLKNKFNIEQSTHVIYNGFSMKNQPKEIKNGDYIVHSGALYGGRRSCDSFIEFFTKKVNSSLKLVFAVFNEEDKIYIEKCAAKYSADIKIKEKLSHQASLDLIANARYCLLALSEDGSDEEYLPIKMYEYIQFEKPIIFCGNENHSEAFEIITKYNIGGHFKKFDFESGSSKESFIKPKQVFDRSYQNELLIRLINNELKKK